MEKNYKPTISEELFERFCRDVNIPFTRIQVEMTQTPDYDIFFGEHLIVAEVKQFDTNDADQEIIDELNQNGMTSVYLSEHSNRVRNKISSAKNQLKSRAKKIHPALLVLYDNVPTKPINSVDIKQAMYGQEIDKISFDKDWQPYLVNEVFGAKPKFTPNENTTFSAIALLEMDQNLSIFHNYYARNRINPDWIRLKNIKHFSIDPISKKGLKDWLEI